MDKKYYNIINLPHHVSSKHPRMSLEQRAAQFAPFAALTGYEDEIAETGRLTDKEIDIGEEVKIELNTKLKKIKENLNFRPHITIMYFVKDIKKDGGKYLTVSGKVKKIDEYNQMIIFEDKTQIPILDIIEIQLL